MTAVPTMPSDPPSTSSPRHPAPVAAVYDRRSDPAPPAPAHPARLHRLNRIFVRTPVYFITFCTHRRGSFLASPAIHETFRQFCDAATAHGVYVGRYVLMPDHVHLFASFAESASPLSAWMKSLKNTLSKSLRLTGHAAPHWQKGFFDHLLRSADSYTQKWDYVRANPVRAGLSPTADTWPYQGKFHDLQH